MSKKMNKYVRNIVAMGLIITCATSIVACSKNENLDDKNNSSINQSKDEGKSEDNNTNKSNSNSNAIAEKSGSIITLGDRALEIFNGNEHGAHLYDDTINEQKKALGKDVDVYNMVVPTHVEFGLPEKYKDMSKPQKPIIDNIYKGLDNDIKKVDAYSNLEKHKDEYIYFNTDHHWTPLGAYYAYEAFAKEAGFKPEPLDKYKKYTKEDFLGTLYTQTQDNKLKENPDHVDYYKIPYDYKVYRYEKENPTKPLKTTLYADYASGVNSYSVFLHGDFPEVKIENKDAKSDKKIAVVKESYANAFVPFLIPHYKEVYVIDSRQYKGSLKELVSKNDIDEVLFLNNIFAANTESIVNTIKNLK